MTTIKQQNTTLKTQNIAQKDKQKVS